MQRIGVHPPQIALAGDGELEGERITDGAFLGRQFACDLELNRPTLSVKSAGLPSSGNGSTVTGLGSGFSVTAFCTTRPKRPPNAESSMNALAELVPKSARRREAMSELATGSSMTSTSGSSIEMG